jgi:hypothetical protein
VRVTAWCLFSLTWLAACLEPGEPCGAGHCVLDKQCVDDRICIDPVQRTTCRGLVEGAECGIDGDTSGACHDDICLPTTCGDGVREGAEECDTDRFENGVADCRDLGEAFHEAGTLRCKADCTVDRAMCGARCGDGVAQAPFEACDGDIGKVTCESAGFEGGDMACSTDCTLDKSRCRGPCGDLVRTGVEVCDGVDFGNQTCLTNGYYYGTLSCSPDCKSVDTTACVGTCGDERKNGQERCDAEAFGDLSCRTYGWYGGVLRCGNDCLTVDKSGCEGYCGDGVRNGNELCDGLDHADISCTSVGAMAGALGCNAYCQQTTDGCYWGRPRTVLRTRPRQFVSVWARSLYDVWASSVDEPLVHFDGFLWRSLDIGLESAVVRFWTPVADQLWALTSGGQLAVLDGTEWRIVSHDVGEHVAATSLSNIWHARGGSEQAMHFDGTTWATIQVGVAVNGVFSLEEGTAWFSTEDETVLVHVSRFQRTEHELPSWFKGCLWGAGDNDVYATFAFDHSVVFHYDGVGWWWDTVGVEEITCGWREPGGDVWMLGSEEGQPVAVLRENGHDWLAPIVTSSQTATNWVADGALWSYTGTEIMRLDEPGWTARATTWGFGPHDTAALWPLDGSRAWIGAGPELYPPSESGGTIDLGNTINAMWATDTSAYVGTSAGVLRYSAGASGWMEGISHVSALWAAGDEDIWAVTGGSLAHYDGAAWTSSMTPPTSLSAASISGTSESNLWATIDGEVSRWTGTQWTRVSLLPTDALSSDVRQVLTTAKDDLWLFDGMGNPFLYDGQTTIRHDRPWSDPVQSAWGDSPRDVWAVTSGQRLYHFDGVVWSSVTTNGMAIFPLRPNVVSGTGDSVWVGGDAGDAYAWRRPPPRNDGDACRDVLRTYCNVTLQGHTAQTVDGPTDCGRGPHAGELHYRIEVPITGKLRARVLSPYDVDLSAVAADARGHCDATNCVGKLVSTGEVELDVEQEDTYFLVVGATEPDTPFTLEVHCEKN